MTWHPPIPSEAVYRDEVAALGTGLRLLWYLYNGVQRDGTVDFSPKRAAESLGVPYETVRNWWQSLKPLGIVTIEVDHGKRGYGLRFDDEWLDWHVLAANYHNPPAVNGSSTVGERSNTTVETVERSVNGFSMGFERSNTTVEPSAYKVLHDDQNPPPPPRTTPVGGGGSRKREAPNETELLLLAFRFSERTAHEFRDLPADVVREELRIARQSGAGAGALIQRWRRQLPNAPPPHVTSPPPQPTRIERPPDALSPQEAARTLKELRRKQQEASHAS